MEGLATIGYGIKITNPKLASEIANTIDEFDADGFVVRDFGGIEGDSIPTFVFILDSACEAYSWEEDVSPIDPTIFVIQPDWNDKLKLFAKEHKIKKPQIGWWLCSSVF